MNIAVRFTLLSVLGLGCLWSQTIGTNGSTAGSTNNSNNNSSPAKFASGLTYNTSFMITGSVMMEDGSAVPGPVDIKLVCSAAERTLTHTTVMDDFEFQWPPSLQMGPVSGGSFASPFTGAISDASSVVNTAEDMPQYCDLRASLPGYTSSEVNMHNPSAFDGSNVGVLWLRPIATPHDGNMVSALSLRAPKEAKKLFDKGTDLLHAGKWPAAATDLQKAVTVYPQYADAWVNLGRAQFKMGAADSARSSLEHAVQLDPKVPGAWQTLGYVAFNQRKWNDAAGYLNQAEQLDPLNSPTPWFYSAMAYFELRKFDQAEKSIREEIDMDPRFQNRRARYVLGLILIARHDVVGGSNALRSYLAGSPDPRDVATVKNVLSQLPPSGRD